VLHSFNTHFFISRKLLTSVNKQLNKERWPVLGNSKELSSREGPLRCIEETDALELGCSIVESFIQKRKKKSAHVQRKFYIKKSTNIRISEQYALIPAPALGTGQNQAVLCETPFYQTFAKHTRSLQSPLSWHRPG